MRRARRKLNSAKGFTLAEMLVVILILVMVAGVVAAGIPVASEAYVKVVDSANAQVLLSTTVAALRDELSTASQVQASGGVLTYRAANGANSRLSLNGEQGILLEEYIDFTQPDASAPSRPLVSSKAATERFYTVYDSDGVSYANGVVTITGLKVKKIGTDQELASLSELKIPVIQTT